MCSQTGKPLSKTWYFASYMNPITKEPVYVKLSEEAFNEPTEFDLMPLVYFRMTKPIKKGSELPPIVDLAKVHE